MLLQIGLEEGGERSSLAWALDFPGCAVAGSDRAAAVVALPQAFLKYADWVSRQAGGEWLAQVGDIDLRLVETCPEGGLFNHDRALLDGIDLARGLQLLQWSRAELMIALAGLSAAELQAQRTDEHGSILGILARLAQAEWLALPAPPHGVALPHEPAPALAAARERLTQSLLTPPPGGVWRGGDGELHSPRKLLRRALWQEREQIGQIYRLRLS